MMLPVRYGPVFSGTLNRTAPVPLTAARGSSIVIQGVLEDAVHEHPDWVLTVTAAEPPAGPNSTLDELRV
jgi:hypothetical protein